MMIYAMQSAENEQVRFVHEIFPHEAQGLVEIWLQQVEIVMKMSLKNEAQKSIEAFMSMNRSEWISSFPGQIILAANLIFWTSDVTNVILNKN